MVKTFTIAGNDAEEIITHISKEFNTQWENNGNDYCFDLPKNNGLGQIRVVQFSHGIHVMEIDIRPKMDIIMHYIKQPVNLLRFLFNSSSDCQHSTKESSSNDKIRKLECISFANGIETEHQFLFGKDQLFSLYIIGINRKLFEEKINEIIENVPLELQGFFRDVNGVNPIYHQSFFSFEVSQLIEEFRHADLEDLVQTVFLEAKTNEILTHQLQNYYEPSRKEKKQSILRQSTIEKIELSIDIIKNEMETGINVHTLAKRVGLNQNTLQSGFKNLFNKSVNGYIQNYRMDYAKKLIHETELNITEITYKIGINSRSYFSKLFKDHFGLSPSTYLIKYRNRNEKSA